MKDGIPGTGKIGTGSPDGTIPASRPRMVEIAKQEINIHLFWNLDTSRIKLQTRGSRIQM
jgi:hypothetical protein